MGWVVAASAAAVVAVIGAGTVWALHDVPWERIARGDQEPVIVLETADGEPLIQQGPFRGPYAALEEFPPHFVNAVLSIEDRRFPHHWGIDPRGIARAAWRNVEAGEVVEGGSTITQQLIKILYLARERTFRRKLQEAVIAIWLEWRLGKDEILTRYLNNVYFGAGATGAPAAARIYFDKKVSDLTLPESALLAGLIRAPSQLNPLTDPDAARTRAEVVLRAMAETRAIDAEALTSASAESAKLNPTSAENRTGTWFSDWVMEEAREIAGPSRGTIRIRTTLVPQLQQLAEMAIRDGLASEAAPSQAALVALTPEGAVVALVGGADYGRSTFNRALALRQPGSTFKLFVYYAALKAGMRIDDFVEDAPLDIGGWRPENAGGRYFGRVSLAEAFARSLNTATVRLMMQIGPEAVIAAARELGLQAQLQPHPSLALGTSEVSLLDITGAYASIRAGAAPIEPWGIRQFRTDEQGRTFRAAHTLPNASGDAGMLREPMMMLLRLAVERGTGREARLDSFAAGKTGTTQNNRDAWFIGFNETLVAGVWVGNDDNTPMAGVSGGMLPARIWKAFMTGANALIKDGSSTSSSPGDAGQPGMATSEGDREESAPSCNIRACARAYRSFRSSDCTYQPYRGERRICDR